jgi:hypothetical protein
MPSDLITLVIRTTCEDLEDDVHDIIPGPTTAASSSSTPRRGSGDEDARNGVFATVGADQFSNASLPDLLLLNRGEGAGRSSSFSTASSLEQQRRQRRQQRRRDTRSTMLTSGHVSCDIAVQTKFSLAMDSNDDYSGARREGMEIEGEERSHQRRANDASQVVVHVDGVSLGRCGETTVVSLTNGLDSAAEGRPPAEHYRVRFPRCWLTNVGSTADAAPRRPYQGAAAATMTTLAAPLRVLSVQESWQPPSDLASSLLARVTVRLDANEREIKTLALAAMVAPSDPIPASTDSATRKSPSISPTIRPAISRIEKDGPKGAPTSDGLAVRRQCPWRRRQNGSGHGCPKRMRDAGEGESGRARGVLHDPASCGAVSNNQPSDAAPDRVLDVNQWFEQERLESNRILALHVFLWMALAVYLVWDAWQSSSRRKRLVQHQRHSPRGRPVRVAHFRRHSNGGRAFDYDDDDDTAATTPESPSSANHDDAPTSSHVRAISTSTGPARGAAVNVFHPAPDEATGQGSLSPVSELKARHLLRIQAKRREKSLQGAASTSTPNVTPLPGVPLRSAAVVTPVRRTHEPTQAHESGLQEAMLRKNLPPPLLSQFEICDDTTTSSHANPARITIMAAAVTPSNQDAGAEPQRASTSSIFGEAIEAAAAARRDDCGTGIEDESQRTSGMATEGSDFQTSQMPNSTRIDPSTTSKPKARRSLRPSRPGDSSSQPRDSILDAFWNLGD